MASRGITFLSKIAFKQRSQLSFMWKIAIGRVVVQNASSLAVPCTLTEQSME